MQMTLLEIHRCAKAREPRGEEEEEDTSKGSHLQQELGLCL